MVIMEVIFCIMLFCMGAVFGSFFTLAVYRIPLGLDITHERSFCPNCNHRLEFIDLIPIVSYLSIGGKCRYCGQPIRIRYLLLEVLSGTVFVVAYFAFKLSFPFFEMSSIAQIVAFVMFYITNAIILGIDKEYLQIDKRVLLFGIITQSLYMVYLCAFEGASLLRYMICLAMLLGLFCLDTWSLKKKEKSYYWTQILMLFVYEISFIDNWKIILGTIVGSGIVYMCYRVFKIWGHFSKFKDEHGKISSNLENARVPIGFCMTLASIVSVLVGNIIL
ncbi:MAG: prepilin peptidase [Clostridia bacterium]|nr:prepilin peptidase [Clostridia bacterium]